VLGYAVPDAGYDSVSGTKYVDLRALLTVRLLRLASSARVARWISTWKAGILAQSISPFDKRLVRKFAVESREMEAWFYASFSLRLLFA
jgi:hypothetical protein